MRLYIALMVSVCLKTLHGLQDPLTLDSPNPSQNISFPLQAGRVGDRMVVQDATGARVKLACVNW